MLESLAADLKYAVRSLRRAPGFTATAFLTLVVGIAGITSLFSYTNAAYFADLPYRDAKRTLAIGQYPGLFHPTASPEAIRLVREQSTSFEHYAVFEWEGVSLDVGAEPLSTQALHIDTAFRAMFGLQTQLGRFLSTEEILGDAPVAVISSALWRSQFGADSSVIGRKLKLSSGTLAVVGVAEEGFRYPHRTDVFKPLRVTTDPLKMDDPEYGFIGRLRPGVPRATAQGEIAVLGRRITADLVKRNNWELRANDEMLNRRPYTFLPVPSLFLGAGLFVLLIACGNVANLFLARGAERSREAAIRASLGATRWRLIRQSLTETLVLGTTAAAVGTALSGLVVKGAMSLRPTGNLPSWFHVSVDYRVLAFSAGVTLLVTIATGLMPARVGTQFDLARSLKVGGEGGGSTGAVGRSSKRGLAIQLALAVALSASSMLFVRTYANLSKIEVGYPAAEIASVTLLFDQARYPTMDPKLPFADAVAAGLDGRPGVSAIAVRGGYAGPRLALSQKAPTDSQRFDGRVIPDRDSTRGLRYLLDGRMYAVSESYFAMLGLRVRAGRGFGDRDRLGSEPVVVVSAAAAKRFWPTSSAIGHALQIDAKGSQAQVVGVVDDTYDLMRRRGGGRTTEPRSNIYFPVRQSVSNLVEILARGRAADPAPARAAIVTALRLADPQLIISTRETTLASDQESAMFETKFFGGLIGAFAAVALFLSIIGIYGVVAFSVSRRTREIGIRIALGGTMANVLSLIIRDSLKFVVIGLGIGLLMAVGLGRLVGALLFGVSAADPLTFVTVCVVFGTVGVVACYLPARRATRVDPLVALRAD